MLFDKCKMSSGMQIEDSNKDNYKPTFWATWSQMYLQMYLQRLSTILNAAWSRLTCRCMWVHAIVLLLWIWSWWYIHGPGKYTDKQNS